MYVDFGTFIDWFHRTSTSASYKLRLRNHHLSFSSPAQSIRLYRLRADTVGSACTVTTSIIFTGRNEAKYKRVYSGQSTLFHINAASFGRRICIVIADMPESFTMARNRSLPACMFSPSINTGCTLCFWKSATITATNSTCASFRPGQMRGPSAQGAKVPRTGSTNFSVRSGDVGSGVETNQRLGRQVRESGPQD